ncbi:MAG: DUF1559 domain-containing protein [Planctomycetes bacterium]|nr:DUF1559 domain-containing protein [Planctomycetota bacterium]MBU4399835.1 DUF1559 domain-containing protein [Planctomycetota bacterium]MCG2682251.1 DUF1559 domain-containing protein [Planctomycetales bacterium]
MTSNEQIQRGGGGLRAAVPAAAKLSLSPVPRPPSHVPSAFTLVELLVVVVIISMLVGLLLPAVMGARANARKTECANNQRQLGVAILGYEAAKKRLPGYANLVRGTTVSWVPVLFPFLGRMDLWEGPNGWRMGWNLPNTPTPYIGLLVCPNDVQSTGDARLTYVINCGLYNDPTTFPLITISNPGQGIFRNYANVPPDARISLSDIRSPSQTVMLSEKLPARPWNTQPMLPTDVGFLWPDTNATGIIQSTLIGFETTVLPAPLPAIHPGVVIVTFCDGHVAEIVEDTPCNLYIGAP